MAEDNRDVLMKIMLKGSPIPAECTATVSSDDTLASGFTGASANGGKGNFFALQDFQMEIGLMADSEAGDDDNPNKRLKAMNDATQKQIKQLWQAQKLATERKPMDGGARAEKYIRFMSKGRAAVLSKSYSSDLEPVSLTKSMDASSLTLFQACKDTTVLDSAVLIKRRGGGGKQLRTYLRVEFTSLLITEFSWAEDDIVKETIKFVCRKAMVQYSIENNDGTLKKPGQPGSWGALASK